MPAEDGNPQESRSQIEDFWEKYAIGYLAEIGDRMKRLSDELASLRRDWEALPEEDQYSRWSRIQSIWSSIQAAIRPVCGVKGLGDSYEDRMHQAESQARKSAGLDREAHKKRTNEDLTEEDFEATLMFRLYYERLEAAWDMAFRAGILLTPKIAGQDLFSIFFNEIVSESIEYEKGIVRVPLQRSPEVSEEGADDEEEEGGENGTSEEIHP